MKISEQLRNIVKQAEETLEELYKNIEEMKNKLEEMELEEKREQEQKTIYNLENGDRYWFIEGFMSFLTFWEDNGEDNAQLTHGNIYLTQQEAEDELRARILIAKAKKSQKGFQPNWNNKDELKNFICYDQDEEKHFINHTAFTNHSDKLGYWEDFYEADDFLEENRDELVWFFTEYKG